MNEQSVETGQEPEATPDKSGKIAGTLGMSLFLVAVSMLFAANIAAYIIVRLRNPEWELPGLPFWIHVSTFLLIGSSMTMQLALGSFRAARASLARTALIATLVLGALYMVSQVLAWTTLLGASVFASSSIFAFTFYMLTVLHAVHVVGGLVPLATLTMAAGRGRYSVDSHEPVKYMTMYWHCLGVIWLVLYATLLATT